MTVSLTQPDKIVEKSSRKRVTNPHPSSSHQ